MACKKNSVDFSYSPTEPRAGQSVQFTNLSYKGKEWNWTYGDGASSSIKSPAHVFKQAGTYRVTLRVNNRKSWTATKEITVYDTVPTFVCEDSVFSVYTDYTFSANVYNPYNYDVTYQWEFADGDEYMKVTGSDQTSASLQGYFTRPMDEALIRLTVIIGEEKTVIEKLFTVNDRATNSLLVRTPEADYRQRIFGARAESLREDESATPLLDSEQDQQQTYNDSLFVLDNLSATFPGIQGFHIAYRKIYYRADGLWVANIDGANPVQIDPVACDAMTLDMKDNRIYWANANGVWYMPFIGSDNNKFVTEPKQLNPLTNVTKLAADGKLK